MAFVVGGSGEGPNLLALPVNLRISHSARLIRLPLLRRENHRWIAGHVVGEVGFASAGDVARLVTLAGALVATVTVTVMAG